MSNANPVNVSSDAWIIEPRAAGVGARGREVWQYRRLLRFFASKALQKLYARTVLGWSWVFIRPLFPLAVKTLVFGSVLNVVSDGLPYFLFLVAGQTIWELFAGGATWGTRSLELNRGLLTRIYVPRLILPVAMLAPAFLNFAIHLGVLILAIAYYRITTGVLYVGTIGGALWSIAGVLFTTLLAVGIALWTSVPALRARDVRFTLNYILGFWVFLTPVMFPLSAVPESWRPWLALNPMVAFCQMFKAAVVPSSLPEAWQIATAVLITILVLFTGLTYFNRAEADAADRV